jgi:hypothetical protein
VQKKITLILSVFLLLTLAAPVQASTPKAGAKCTKAGTTSISSGKKFTCVKSGTKLVWNKGVAVKAAPKPSPNPVFKPVEPTPTSTPMQSPTPTATPAPSVKPVEFNATAKKAFDIIQAAKIQSSNLTYTYRIGKFAAPDVAKVVQRYVENAAQIYSLFLDSPRVVTIHVYTEKDMPALLDSPLFANQTGLKRFTDSWINDASQINSSVGHPGTYINGECSISIPTQCTGPGGHAGAAYPSRATALTLDQHNLAVPSHELFHVVQDFYRFNGKPQYLVTEEVKDLSMRPVFREGGASFMALSSSLTDFALYEEGATFYKNWAAKEFAADIKGLNSPEDVVSLLVKLERLDRSARLYGLGTFLHEWLIANHGLDKFVSLTKKHNVGKEFNELFTETYGMSLKDAYTKAAPHILERVKG